MNRNELQKYNHAFGSTFAFLANAQSHKKTPKSYQANAPRHDQMKGEVIESGVMTIDHIEKKGLFERFIGWIKNEL